MTTPEIHRFVTFPTGSWSGSELYKPTNETIPLGGDGYSTGNDAEDRGPSVSVPIVEGWRNCAPWYHYGGTISIGGATINYEDSLRVITAGGMLFRLAQILPGYGTGVPLNVQQHSLNKAMSKIKSQKLQLSVFMAELGRSVRMVDSRLASIAGTIVSFRRKFPKLWEEARKWQRGGLPRHLWCNIPSQWLEVQYGWKPLMSDITSIINLTAKKESPKVSAHATHKVESVFEVVFEPAPGLGLPIQVPAMQRFIRKDRATTWLYYALRDYEARNADQLGLANPGELVWELLPMSFIVDWALPIGEWIGNLTADSGLEFRGGGQSQKVEIRPSDGVAGQFYNGQRFAGSPVTGRIDNFGRSCYDASPVPGIYVKNPLSTMHLANGLSLLATSMQR